MRLVTSILILSAVSCCFADVQPIDLLRSIADGGSVPDERAFYEVFNDNVFLAMGQAELFTILDVAAPLLKDDRKQVQRYALGAIMASTIFRQNANQILEPYLPTLEEFFEKGNTSLRNLALYIMVLPQPPLSPRTVGFLRRQVGRPGLSDAERGQLAASLLLDRSAAVTEEVIQLAKQMTDPAALSHILHNLGYVQTTNETALKFIGDCLESEKVQLHISAISAIIRLLPAQRVRYYSQLGRLAADPAEDEQVREWAGDILNGKR